MFVTRLMFRCASVCPVRANPRALYIHAGQVRGVCRLCGRHVVATELQIRFEDGAYAHAACMQANQVFGVSVPISQLDYVHTLAFLLAEIICPHLS